jgi:hypothetical protein
MKKPLMLLGSFLLLSVMTAGAQTPEGKTKVRPSEKSELKSSEVKNQPASASIIQKFRLTKAEFDQLTPAKKEYIQKHPEMFEIINEK